MFNVIANKGFQLTFKNGWTISVMFGCGNYCDNRNMELPRNMLVEHESLLQCPQALSLSQLKCLS